MQTQADVDKFMSESLSPQDYITFKRYNPTLRFSGIVTFIVALVSMLIWSDWANTIIIAAFVGYSCFVGFLFNRQLSLIHKASVENSKA